MASTVRAAVRSRVRSRMNAPGAPIISETYEKLWDTIPVYQIGEEKPHDYVLLLQLAQHFCITLGVVYDVIDKFPEKFRSPSASLVRLGLVDDRSRYNWIFEIARNIGTVRSVPSFIDVNSANFFKDIALPRYLVEQERKERNEREEEKKTKSSSSSSTSSSMEPVVLLGQAGILEGCGILDGPPTDDEDDEKTKKTKKKHKKHKKYKKQKKRKKRKDNPCDPSRSAAKVSRATLGVPSMPSVTRVPSASSVPTPPSGAQMPLIHSDVPHYIQLANAPLGRDFGKLQFTKMGHLFMMRYGDLMKCVKPIWPSFYSEHYECTGRTMVLLPPTVFKGPKGPTLELVYNKDNPGLKMTRMGHLMFARYKDALFSLHRRYKASSPEVQEQFAKLKQMAFEHNEHTRQIFRLLVCEHTQLIKAAEDMENQAKNKST